MGQGRGTKTEKEEEKEEKEAAEDVPATRQVVDVPVVVRQGAGPQLQFLAKVVFVAVQRQVLWSEQCRTLFGSSQLQFLDKVIDVPVFNDTCPWRSGHSSCTRSLTCPLFSTTRAHGGPDTVLGQGY